MRTILIWFQSGGPFIWPLLVVGLAGLALFIDRATRVVLESRINSRPFIERVISLVRSGKAEEALVLCAEHRSSLPDLGVIILRSRARSETDLTQLAEAGMLMVAPRVTRRLGWFSSLAVLAVLIGAAGAVANLHQALSVTSLGPAAHSDVIMAITYALRPLGAGIVTAIPLVAGHAYLRHESQRIVGQLEEFAVRLTNALIDRPDVRLGHR